MSSFYVQPKEVGNIVRAIANTECILNVNTNVYANTTVKVELSGTKDFATCTTITAVTVKSDGVAVASNILLPAHNNTNVTLHFTIPNEEKIFYFRISHTSSSVEKKSHVGKISTYKKLEFKTNAILIDFKPRRILVNLNKLVQEGSIVENVYVSLNSHTASPTWTDVTTQVLSKQPILNVWSTQASYSVSVKYIATKTSAVDRLELRGIGVAYL